MFVYLSTNTLTPGYTLHIDDPITCPNSHHSHVTDSGSINEKQLGGFVFIIYFFQVFIFSFTEGLQQLGALRRPRPGLCQEPALSPEPRQSLNCCSHNKTKETLNAAQLSDRGQRGVFVCLYDKHCINNVTAELILTPKIL